MNASVILMPMMVGSGGLTMALTNSNRPLLAAVGLLMVVVAIALAAVMWISMRLGPRRKLRQERERYLDYLDDMRATVRKAARAQHRANDRRHPHPRLLHDIAAGPQRRWERRSTDPDLLSARCGLARVRLNRPLSLKIDHGNPLTVYDPVCQSSAEELVERYIHLGSQPLIVPIGSCGTVSVVGDYPMGRQLTRSMLAQLASHVAPEDLRVAVVRHGSLTEEWDWTHYLPHLQGANPGIEELPSPVVCESIPELAAVLADEFERRIADLRRRRSGAPAPGTQHLIIVVDGEHQVSMTGLWDEANPAHLGIHVITIVAEQRAEPETVEARMEVAPSGVVTSSLLPGVVTPPNDEDEAPQVTGTVDCLSHATAAGIATSISPFRLAETDSGEALHRIHGLAEIIGVPDPATLDAPRKWREHPPGDVLRVPLGVTAEGGILDLDLKESSLGGMGPHGLIIGATGSGKSEALRTLVMALTTRHSPEELALLTVDFKGGATFAECDRLPHNAGSITNLVDDLSLVDRFEQALYGEMLRRQQLLKDVGNLPNLHEYQRLRSQRPDLDSLPHLLVIIDEFSELLTAKPDFSDLFLAVGRIGRSIGVHLLLATQRLESGHIRGLESHLSYRIGLRTFSEAESREAIGVVDAYKLPPDPGSGYLKVDTTVFTRFKAAMVSSPYRPPARESDNRLPTVDWPPPLLPPLPADRSGPHSQADQLRQRSVLQVLVDRISAADATPVRPVWLPPLPKALSLDAIPEAVDATAAEYPQTVAAVFGLHDKPREQRQDPLTWDMTGGESNLLIVGAPSSGKSMLIRSLVSSLTLRYTPGQVACFCVDYGGGSLSPLSELPHVASVAGRAEPELTRRVLSDIRTKLDERESLMMSLRLDSPERLRAARAEGQLPSDVSGDIVLIVDGWGTLRDIDSDLEDVLIEIAARGPALGVHLVLTVVSANQVRSRLSAAIGGRIELRLTDPFDSGIDRKASEAIPKDLAGRVLLSDEMYGHIALPRIDGETGIEDLRAAMSRLADTAADRWSESPVPPVRTLPSLVTLDELLSPLAAPESGDGYGTRPVLGVSERDLGRAEIDFAADPHLVLFGDPQTGKSTALRSIMRQITRRPPSEVGIALFDYRRSHLEEVPEDYLVTYATSGMHAAQAANEVAKALAERLPGPDVTPQQLRDRSWWNGLDLFVVVDDLDLVTT
ncbi:MAG: type VII secretion protein EccCa, partial [Stackebrandtia sp.]